MYTQEDLDKVLDNLHQGPISKRSEGNWERSFRQRGNKRSLSSQGRKNLIAARVKERIFTPEQVHEIKYKYTNDVSIPVDLAIEYNTTLNMVWNILLNKYYRFQDEEVYGPPVVKKRMRRGLVKEINSGVIGGLVELSDKFNISCHKIRSSIKKEVSINNLRFVKVC